MFSLKVVSSTIVSKQKGLFKITVFNGNPLRLFKSCNKVARKQAHTHPHTHADTHTLEKNNILYNRGRFIENGSFTTISMGKL